MSDTKCQKIQTNVRAKTPHVKDGRVSVRLDDHHWMSPDETEEDMTLIRLQFPEWNGFLDLLEGGEDYVLELRRGTLESEEDRATMADEMPNADAVDLVTEQRKLLEQAVEFMEEVAKGLEEEQDAIEQERNGDDALTDYVQRLPERLDGEADEVRGVVARIRRFLSEGPRNV